MVGLKKILLIPMILLVLFLSACEDYYFNYENKIENNFEYYYDIKWNDGFISAYIWDGDIDNNTIIIPEKFNDCVIKSLGGTTLRYNPANKSFSIRNSISSENNYILSEDLTLPNKKIGFTIIIGKEINAFYLSDDIEFVAEIEEGGAKALYLVTPVYYFVVDSENSKFYSDNGALYYKNGTAVQYE